MRSPSLRNPLFALPLLAAACGSDPNDATPSTPDAIVVTDAASDAGIDTTDTGPPPLAPCDDNLDCAGGEICRGGLCRASCVDDEECGGGYPICDAERGFCVGCLAASDCDGPAAACIDERCVFGCGSDDDCDGDERCTSAGACVVPECARDADCRGGFRCDDLRCVPIDPVICEGGTARCEGNALVVCNRDGTRETSEDCGDARCVASAESAECLPEICAPDEVTCLDGQTAGLCTADGTSYDELPCTETQYCDAGACRARVCLPSSAVCNGDAIVTCDELGSAETTSPCADLPECAEAAAGCGCVDATCVPRICAPGSRRCVGNASQACLDDGSGWGAPEGCTGDDVCLAGSCTSPRCDAGSTECSGDTLLTCEEDERTRTERSCTAEARICVTEAGASRCDERLCEPSSVSCSSDRRARVLCDGRGASTTLRDCDDGEFCVSGTCQTLACDPRSCSELDAAGVSRPDTDDDGIADCIEGLLTGPGGLPACADPDQDGDGLLDGEEPTCPGRNAVILPDTDGDGWDDLVETLAGSDPCDASDTPTDLADAVVVFDAGDTSRTVELTLTAEPPPTDIVLLVDTTGSMVNTIEGLQANATGQLHDVLTSEMPDVAFGLATYADFPCTVADGATATTGSGSDRPFRLAQRVTRGWPSVDAQLQLLSAAGGGDGPESTHEALFQLSTGLGVSGCGMTVPAFDPTRNRLPGVADGPNPGMGFRDDSEIIVLHFTDAVAQTGSAYPPALPYARRSDALDALEAIGARYGGIATGLASIDVRNELADLADAINPEITPCAWGEDRPADCSTSECCTGRLGTGVLSVDGVCTLRGSALSNVASSVVPTATSLARGLVFGTPYDLSVQPRLLPDSDGSLDSLVRSVAATAGRRGVSTCEPPTVDAPSNRWQQVRVGNQLVFDVRIDPAGLVSRSRAEVAFDAETGRGQTMGTANVLVIVR